MSDKHTPAQEVALWLDKRIKSGLWYANDIIPVIEQAYARVIDAELEFKYKLIAENENLIIKCDAEMERVKACEHIAEGEEGWQALRNICPSTMAVAKLRDDYEAGCTALKEICKGAGAYDRDPLKHAENTIEDMKGLARAALARVRGE